MPSRPAIIPTVFVNGFPDPTLRALSIVRAAGGGVLDTATYQLDLAKQNSRLVNIVLSSGAGAEVRVTALVNGSLTLLHWGKATVSSIKLDANTEMATVTSRTEPWHFGAQLTGMLVWEPVSAQLLTVPEDPVFNRVIDDAAQANQSGMSWLAGQSPVFLDAESVRTAAAQTLQGGTANAPALWTLQSAIQYLCFSLNQYETYIKNPDNYDLLPTWQLSDVTLPRGQYLPFYLDLVLTPYGLGWYLDLSNGNPQIAFFARGQGDPQTLYLGPPGSTAQGNDQPAEVTVDWNLGSTKIQITVWGDWHYVESTFQLVRAWY